MAGFRERFRAWPIGVRVGLFVLAAAVVFVLAGAAPMMVPPSADWPWPWTRIANGVLATAGALVITHLFIKSDGLDAKAIGVAIVSGSLGRLLIGVGIGLAMFGLHLTIITFIGGGIEFERDPDVGFKLLGLAALTYLLLSAMEEVAFRGYAMRVLDARYGLWVAQLVIAALFVFYHVAGGQDPMSALLGTGLGSLCFGMAAMASRGLALPMGLHAAWNFVDWMIGGKSEASGAWGLAIDEAALPRVQLVATTSYFVVLGGATLVFWWWYRKRVEVAPV
jgi:CAAX protease family protein